MIFKNTQFDHQRARLRLEQLIKTGKTFELTAKAEPKSLAQNRYFHLICGWLGIELGYSLEYTKQNIVKRLICPDTFVVERVSTKTGEAYQDVRSFAELTDQETTAIINRVRTYASTEWSIYLPEPSDLAAMYEIEIELKRNQEFL